MSWLPKIPPFTQIQVGGETAHESAPNHVLWRSTAVKYWPSSAVPTTTTTVPAQARHQPAYSAGGRARCEGSDAPSAGRRSTLLMTRDVTNIATNAPMSRSAVDPQTS